MTDQVRLACEPDVLMIPMPKILPTRMPEPGMRGSAKYKCIKASIKELGVVEPLVVFPQPDSGGCFMLLDGRVRYMILKDLGEPSAKCLIAMDDEGFTYNHKISRLTAIQEHFMIMRAIKSGVPEARIARALDVRIHRIREKRDLLEGICPEAVQLLKDRQATAPVFQELRKVKPFRQIEIAELLCASNNFSVGYAKCLVTATPQDQTVAGMRLKAARGLSPEEVARMEREMGSLEREFKLIEESHGRNVLNLVIVVGYLRKLLENQRVARFLSQNYPEISVEFQKLSDAKNLQDGSAG